MRIVDLFSGAGGLTFGFYYSVVNGRFVRNQANNIVFANECDSDAAASFRLNFPDIPLLEQKIEDITDHQIRGYIDNDEVDLIIGGPPCQSFSTIGKRQYDDRAKMYVQFLRILRIVRPRMFVFENVKGILSMKDDDGQLVMDTISEKFSFIDDDLGYKIYNKTLNAVNFGVPQNRERVFIVGVRNDQENILWDFPKGNDKIITLQEAISDFSDVLPGQTERNYIAVPQNPYQILMRNGNTFVSYHTAATHGDKIQTVIENVGQGEGHDDFNRKVERGEVARQYFLTSGYGNTYGRLCENQPCTTITHNMSTPSGLRCIHYQYHRALTPREGARIQSFPDSFQFAGSLVKIRTQIGNAVPPLLAVALSQKISNVLEGRNG